VTIPECADECVLEEPVAEITRARAARTDDRDREEQGYMVLRDQERQAVEMPPTKVPPPVIEPRHEWGCRVR